MQKGWKATGLLQPLWSRYPGRRDALATAVGTTGTALSAVNSGNRNLGPSLAQRLAEELGVSVFELGATAAEAADDPKGQTLRARLDELATTLGDSLERQKRLEAKVARLQARVRKLEAPRVAAAAAAKGPR